MGLQSFLHSHSDEDGEDVDEEEEEEGQGSVVEDVEDELQQEVWRQRPRV